jgi:hypothetical protein
VNWLEFCCKITKKASGVVQWWNASLAWARFWVPFPVICVIQEAEGIVSGMKQEWKDLEQMVTQTVCLS